MLLVWISWRPQLFLKANQMTPQPHQRFLMRRLRGQLHAALVLTWRSSLQRNWLLQILNLKSCVALMTLMKYLMLKKPWHPHVPLCALFLAPRSHTWSAKRIFLYPLMKKSHHLHLHLKSGRQPCYWLVYSFKNSRRCQHLAFSRSPQLFGQLGPTKWVSLDWMSSSNFDFQTFTISVLNLSDGIHWAEAKTLQNKAKLFRSARRNNLELIDIHQFFF